MAFTGNSRGNSTNNAAGNEDWKAQGFLNIYIPTGEGKRVKLGAIPLKDSRPNEKKILDKLKADPTKIDALKNLVVFEYRDAEPAQAANFEF